MIRIHRPAPPPEILTTQGAAQAARDVAAFEADPDAYRAGRARFAFDPGIYGHATVKATLSAAQHDKCCFCESKISHVAFGDIEHFRPKASVRASKGRARRRPGYFWLAYRWSNLLFCCEPCNRRGKGDLFPLAKGSPPADAPSGDLAAEAPLFIDPAAEDPSLHIGFRQEVAYAVEGSARGRRTIDALALNRPALVERRLERWQLVETLREIVAMDPTSPQAVLVAPLIDAMESPDAEHSAMVNQPPL